MSFINIFICLSQMLILLNDEQRQQAKRTAPGWPVATWSLSHTAQRFQDRECTVEHLMPSFPHSVMVSVEKELWEIGV